MTEEATKSDTGTFQQGSADQTPEQRWARADERFRKLTESADFGVFAGQAEAVLKAALQPINDELGTNFQPTKPERTRPLFHDYNFGITFTIVNQGTTGVASSNKQEKVFLARISSALSTATMEDFRVTCELGKPGGYQRFGEHTVRSQTSGTVPSELAPEVTQIFRDALEDDVRFQAFADQAKAMLEAAVKPINEAQGLNIQVKSTVRDQGDIFDPTTCAVTHALVHKRTGLAADIGVAAGILGEWKVLAFAETRCRWAGYSLDTMVVDCSLSDTKENPLYYPLYKRLFNGNPPWPKEFGSPFVVSDKAGAVPLELAAKAEKVLEDAIEHGWVKPPKTQKPVREGSRLDGQ